MSPCRAASTHPWPPRCWPKRATRLSACRCSSTTSATASRATAAAAASTISTTPAASPGASTSRTTSSISSASFSGRSCRTSSSEYVAGRTPIPCAHCNSDLKFATLLDRSMAYGAEVVATGHYARIGIDAETGRHVLRRGLDAAKDQTYFLFSLTQEQLSRASFPVGDLSKDAVRDVARRLGLAVAEKPDSQEICFVPDGDYAAFIERKTGDLGERRRDRQSVGRRAGTPRRRAPLYRRTAQGARHRRCGTDVRLATASRRKRRSSSGPRPELERTSLTASQVNWIAGVGARRTAARDGTDPPSPSAGCRHCPRPRRQPRVDGVRRARHGDHARTGGGVLLMVMVVVDRWRVDW